MRTAEEEMSHVIGCLFLAIGGGTLGVIFLIYTLYKVYF